MMIVVTMTAATVINCCCASQNVTSGLVIWSKTFCCYRNLAPVYSQFKIRFTVNVELVVRMKIRIFHAKYFLIINEIECETKRPNRLNDSERTKPIIESSAKASSHRVNIWKNGQTSSGRDKICPFNLCIKSHSIPCVVRFIPN